MIDILKVVYGVVLVPTLFMLFYMISKDGSAICDARRRNEIDTISFISGMCLYYISGLTTGMILSHIATETAKTFLKLVM